MARRDPTDNRAQRKVQHRRRDRAFVVGLLAGVGIVAAAIVGALLFGSHGGHGATDWSIMAIAGGVLLVGGIWGWVSAQRMDEKNYMIQKTTPMPLRLVNVKDDVWIEGTVRVPHPAVAPHFGTACAYYRYTLEERRTRTVRRNNRTTTESYWVTIQDTTRYARAFLVEDDVEVEIDLRNARFDYIPTRAARLGKYRHNLSYLAWKGAASASGVLVPNPRMAAAAGNGNNGDGDGAMRDARTHVHERQRSRYLGDSRSPSTLGLFDSLFGRPRGRETFGKLALRRQQRLDQAEHQHEIAERLEAQQRKGQVAQTRRLARRSDDAKVGVEVDEDLTPMEVDGEAPEPEPAKRADVPATRTPLLLTKAGNVPLIVTPVTREEWVDRAEANETHYRVGSLIVVWGGLAALVSSAFATFAGFSDVPTAILLGIGVAGLVLAPVCTASLYNRFVGYRTRVASAWAQIDVLLKMRRELVPNLVATVESSAAHERDTLETIAKLRAGSLDAAATSGTEAMRIENAMTRLSRELVAVVEAYPDLKSDASYQRLIRELTAIEEKVAWSRSFYNETVREFNVMIEALPNSLLASPLGFKALPYWRDDS